MSEREEGQDRKRERNRQEKKDWKKKTRRER